MAVMIIRQKVKDFAAWKATYDKYDDARKDSGVKMAAIHRDPDDPNIVIVMHQFDDIDEVYNFTESEGARALMERAGIVGKPEIWYGEDVQLTIY